MDIKAELLKSVVKNINVPGLVDDAIDNILGQALKNLVASTANPIDDVLVAALLPLLSSEIKNLVHAKWAALVAA